MDRKTFLRSLGLGTAAIVLAVELDRCKKKDQKVDFTINLTDQNYSILTTPGGYAVANNIIIAHDPNGNFVAVSDICTHQGCNLVYTGSSNQFYCPCHGSLFDTSGNATRGPATTALKKYNTSLNGSTLRIYE